MYDPPTILRKDVNVMFDDIYNHLVLGEAPSVIALQPWGAAYDYI